MSRVFRTSIFLSVIILAIAICTGCRHASGTSVPVIQPTLYLAAPLWSPSGNWLLTRESGADMSDKLLSVNLASRRANVVAEGGVDYFIESWAWSSRRDELCYVSHSNRGRMLRICTATGRVIRERHLPGEFSSVGLEWMRDKRIVVVDTTDPIGDGDPRGTRPSVVRVLSEGLKQEREIELPFTIYDMQLHPGLSESIVAVAGGKYSGNIISIDVTTEHIQQITYIGGVPYGPGRWEVAEHDKVYFIGVEEAHRLRGLQVYNAATGKVETVIKGGALGGPITRFDVFGNIAAVASRGQLNLFDLATHHTSVIAPRGSYYCPRFSPDGRRLAVLKGLGRLVVKDVRANSDTLLYVATSDSKGR